MSLWSNNPVVRGGTWVFTFLAGVSAGVWGPDLLALAIDNLASLRAVGIVTVALSMFALTVGVIHTCIINESPLRLEDTVPLAVMGGSIGVMLCLEVLHLQGASAVWSFLVAAPASVWGVWRARSLAIATMRATALAEAAGSLMKDARELERSANGLTDVFIRMRLKEVLRQTTSLLEIETTDGCVSWCNDALIEYLDEDPTDMLVSEYFDTFSPQTQAPVTLQYHDKSVATGEIGNSEHTLPLGPRGGPYRSVTWYSTSVVGRSAGHGVVHGEY